MTKFEQAQQDVKDGKLRTPAITSGVNQLEYFAYQLEVHHFNLKVLARGIKFRDVKLSDLKDYYGLSGRSAKDCLPQFEKILADYKAKLAA